MTKVSDVTATRRARKSSCQNLNVSDRMLALDRYASPLPFNVNGQTEIRSFPGMIVTCVLSVFLIAYAV